jgi:hypothetical protein
MSFRKITNPQEYTALVDQFLTARESLKKSVRQNKLGLSEAEYQQTLAQQPTITAIEKLGEKIQTQQQPTVSAIQKLTEKLSKKKQENDAEGEKAIVAEGAKAIPSGIAKAEIGEEADEEFDAATEMERIALFLDRVTSKRFKPGAMTVDSNGLLGGTPVKLDFQRGIARVGDRQAKLSLPLVELLYGPSSAVSKRNYDSDTIIDYNLLTRHIDKKHLGRSSKYQLILNYKERQMREENWRKRVKMSKTCRIRCSCNPFRSRSSPEWSVNSPYRKEWAMC